MARFINPRTQYFTSSGELMPPGSSLQFFESGTSTDKDTFADADLTTLNTNPLVLTGDARVPSCFYDGVARVRLLDDVGAVVWDLDPVGSDTSSGAFAAYSASTTYATDDIVTFNNKFYRSKIDNNQNNQPDSSLVEWEEVQFNRVYNSTTTYAANDVVTSDGITFRSRVGSNIGNDPASSPTQWANTSGIGKQTVVIPSGSMTSRATSGAPPGSVETTTNKVMIESKDFDNAADEFVQFSWQMPENWDAGVVSAKFLWSHAATATNFGVAWAIQAFALVDDDPIDTAFGTAIVTVDTGGTTNDRYISAESSDVTIANTPVKSSEVIFQVFRDVSDAGDTMTIDARLGKVTLFYTTVSSTDN